MARDPNKPTRMDGILNNIPKILDELTYSPESVDRRFSNATAKTLEPFYKPNLINDNRVPQPVFPLSILEGRGVQFVESDRTMAGPTLVGIGNQPLARHLDLNTGVDHIFYPGQPTTVNGPRGSKPIWASAPGVVNKFLKRAAELEKTTGQPTFLLPFEGGYKSNDWWTGTGKAMINYNLANAPDDALRMQEQILKDRIPNWPGSADPMAMTVWEATPGSVRMGITQELDQLKNVGGLSEGQARVATSRVESLNSPMGTIANIGLLDTQADYLLNKSPDYGATLMGQPVGVLDTPVTAFDFTREQTTATGQPLNIRALQMRDTSKVISPEEVSKVVTYNDLRDLEDKGIKIDEPAPNGKKDSGTDSKSGKALGVLGFLTGFFNLAYSGQEVEAGVLTGTLENTADIAGKVGRVERKKEAGEPLTEGDIMSGRGGQTFLTLEQEARARVYDEFRRQVSEFDTPLFDTSKAGTVTIGDRGGVEGVSRYTFPEEYQGATTEVGVETPDLVEIKPTDEGAQLFREKILAGKESSKYGAAVEAYDADTYKDMRLFLTDDGSAGYALTSDGDIVSAFSTGQHIGVGPHLIMHGIEQGGKKLDAFDTVLPDMYATMGMRETSRLAFDPTQAPPDWNEAVFGKYQGGRPDVSFMALDRDFATPVSPNMVNDYGEAVDLQNLAVGLLDSPTVRGSDPLSIMPAPQRFFDPDSKAFKPFLQGDFESGGRYLSMGEGQRDVSGMYPDSASIAISPDGKPSFQVSGQSATGLPSQKGRQIKSNLFKKSAGWDWTKVPEGFDPNPDKSFSLVSVKDGSKHYYSLGSNYPEGVNLKRYPMSKDEPRLRPTMKGEVSLGNVVGEIEVRGKKHPVYDNVTVQPKAAVAAAAVGTGLLGTSEESDASVAKLLERGMRVVGEPDPRDSRVGEYFLQAGDDTKSIGNLFTESAETSGYPQSNFMASADTFLADQYRGQGIAQEMYDAVEEITGNTLVPSEILTADGARLWASRNPDRLSEVSGVMDEAGKRQAADALSSTVSYPSVRSDASSLDDDFARMQQNADGGIINQMMAQNARKAQLAKYGDALKSRREAIKLKDTTRKLLDVDRPGTLQLGTEFAMRGTEDLAKVIVGATGSLFSPDSGFYEKVSGSDSVFGKPSEAYEDVTGAIAAGLEKYVIPELKKAFAWKGDSGRSINDKVDKTVQDVVAAYTATPQSFQDSVTPRLPYAGTLLLSVFGLGLGKGAVQGGKRIVGEPGGPGILGWLNPLEGELVMPEGLPNSKPIGLLQ
jgi:hypothetical protein